MDQLGGAASRMPLTCAALVVAGFSLVGVPATAGFISKWLLIVAALEQGAVGIGLVALILALLVADAAAGEPLLMHISNFRKVKRVDDVIRIFAGIRREMGAKLVLIGDGPERTAATELAGRLGVQDDIVFLGMRTDSSVRGCFPGHELDGFY